MIRAVPLLLAAAAAASPPGCVTPRARLVATVKEGTHPTQVLLSCQVHGLSGVLQYTWRLGTGLRVTNGATPKTEAALLVQLAEPLLPAQAYAECAASDESGGIIGATTSLAPLVIQKVTPQPAPAPLVIQKGTPQPAPAPGQDPNAQLTVEGSGFGPSLAVASEDGLYFVPARGATVRADHACKAAVWTDTRIVACRPPLLGEGPYELRVEAGGRLAVAPGPPLAVK
jgi:hypothetical protein